MRNEGGKRSRMKWLLCPVFLHSWMVALVLVVEGNTFGDINFDRNQSLFHLDPDTHFVGLTQNFSSLSKFYFSNTQTKDTLEVGTEKYPWQNPWYKDYGKFRRNNEPVFDNNMVTNVTAQLGETAFLHCRVRNLGERPVSWIRRRDWHILTSGLFTYTNDERFQVIHTEGGDNWTLQIKYVQKRDNGTYECQVATGAGTMSHYFNLHIVVPTAFILGSGEYHIEQGSTISLVCIIENSPTPPQYVFWYHNDRMINYDAGRSGVSVKTEPGPKTHSRLIINNAKYVDSGNYSCRASNTESDTIHVFVSEDKTAAIQRGESSFAVSLCSDFIFVSFYILTVTCLWIMR